MLVLVRGLPGSGKTTFAKWLVEAYPWMHHFEADMWFERFNDENFDPTKLKEAHEWCLNSTKESLMDDWVVVSNTFTQLWEMQPYLELEKPVVYRMACDFGSVHNVPEKTLKKMKQRFEDFQGEMRIYNELS